MARTPAEDAEVQKYLTESGWHDEGLDPAASEADNRAGALRRQLKAITVLALVRIANGYSPADAFISAEMDCPEVPGL